MSVKPDVASGREGVSVSRRLSKVVMGLQSRIAVVSMFMVSVSVLAGSNPSVGSQTRVGRETAEGRNIGPYASGDLVLWGTVVTMNGPLEVEPGAGIYIRDGRIAAIIPAGEPIPSEAEGVAQLRTDGFVYPGLLNAHNHLAYNVLPSWEMPRIDDRPFNNRQDWREGLGAYQAARASYSRNLVWPKNDLMDAGLAPEIGKWAEIKELVAGTTATQGSFSFRRSSGSDEETSAFAEHLVRNVDLSSRGAIRQSSSGILNYRHPHDLNERLLDDVLVGVDRGRIEAFLVHMSEGTGEASRQELYALNDFGRDGTRRCGPLMTRAVVIHGTSYETEEFQLMAECGADLVAAPLSNLLYYGRAPNLADAMAAGVRVSLSTDWSPVGSKNLLVELKVVDFLNKAVYGGRLSDADLVRMVTSNPAESLGWGDRAGRLEPGFWGDLLVVSGSHTDPYRALIEATERDVALVVVGGEPLYGDVDMMRALKPGDHEVIETGCGFQKAIDVTTSRPGVDRGWQSFGTLESTLRDGFRVLEPSLRARGVSPLYACQDFEARQSLRGSENLAYFNSRLADLPSSVDRYYEVVASPRSGSGGREPDDRTARGALDDETSGSSAGGGWSTAVVRRVIDGDTVWIEYGDGSGQVVRLWGIDAPEVFSPNEPSRFGNLTDGACLDDWGHSAMRYVTEALEGRRVRLVAPGGASTSRFGQLMAYLHLNGDDFNARLVALGYAKVFVGPDGGPRVDAYLQLQQRAKEREMGLWACSQIH